MDTQTVFDYFSETFQLPDKSYVNCEIMDTGGQEEFNAINKIYYKRADCCLLVYDITNKESFEEIEKYYVKEISDLCKKDIKVILLGNKTDLEKERKISQKEGVNLAQKYKYYFMETSCIENYNVANAFEAIIMVTNTEMIKKGKINYNSKIDIEEYKKKEKNKCC